jgi:hypothetical protein
LNGKQKGDGVPLPADPDYRGQPGFAKIEQTRFTEILREGRLVDAYRSSPQGSLRSRDRSHLSLSGLSGFFTRKGALKTSLGGAAGLLMPNILGKVRLSGPPRLHGEP